MTSTTPQEPSRTAVPPRHGVNTEAARRQAAQDLYALCARLAIEDAPSGRHRLRQRAIGLLRPVLTAARARAMVRAHGEHVRRLHDVSLSTQRREIRMLMRRYGFTADEYYRYRLFERDRLADAPMFLPWKPNLTLRDAVYRRCGIDDRALGDKRIFYKECATAGLPSAATIAEFDAGAVRWWPGFSSLPELDLFAKRADRLCGEGAERWTRVDGGFRSDDGRMLSPDQLVQDLSRRSTEGAFVLQRRLQNHDSIADLSTGGLSTVRVITVRWPEQDPVHLRSIFRMPTGTLPADNFAAGGLASRVDAESGRLGVAVRKAISSAIDAETLEAHPDTGATILGRPLPGWDAVIPLCLEAHRRFLDFPSVGWDVALTTEGPVFLEGNFNWDVILAQQPEAQPLWHSIAVDVLLSFLPDRSAREPSLRPDTLRANPPLDRERDRA